MSQIVHPKGPVGLNAPKSDEPKRRKPMRRKSKKREEYERSLKGKQDLAHMDCVRELPCCICGTTVNVKAHHCKDMPPFVEWGIYERLPLGTSRKSGPTDTIPLCEPGCHKDSGHGYHDSPEAWRAKHGPDYSYIERTRQLVQEMQESVSF